MIQKTKVPKAMVSETMMSKAELPNAHVQNAKVSKAKLPNAKFLKSKLSKSKLPNTKLPKAKLFLKRKLALHCLGSLLRCHCDPPLISVPRSSSALISYDFV